MDRPVRGDQLVNVLFTSGSTGKPKGVMLRHRSISNLYSQMKTLLEPVEGNVLCSTNSVFDCFVVETLIALALGRSVVLADEEEMMLPWKLANLVDTYNTGIFEMTPSRLQMCLGNEAFCQAAHKIKIVLLGGEVVTQTLSEQFYRYSDGVLMNMYGPTEATVFTTMGAVVPGEHITIGKPLQNTRTYVLDENLRPVLPTACGEMYIAGECLAAGYISRPELTESSFVEDIYFPGEKMYRSGDLVRLRTDGSYDYVGRKDHQVKLNGQRVELSEITGAILEVDGVKQAATVAVRREDGSMELCAFYEKEESYADHKERMKEQILTHLQKVLPAYMIPSRMLEVEHIPMTATNKIDMQTLQKMALEGTALTKEPTPVLSQEVVQEQVQESEVSSLPEKMHHEITPAYVLSVWNRVLSIPAKDIRVSFFEQGGTSMAALNVLSYYFNDHLEMALSDFYEYPTAESQAMYLREKYPQEQTQGQDIYETVNQITLEEVLNDQKDESSFNWDVEHAPLSAMQKSKAVLVTGGTGFFGAHLVKALLDEKRQVICLMRDGDLKRLQKCLAWYFGQGAVLSTKNQLKVVRGDIAETHLGMSERDYVLLVSRIGEIYHCAADVRHYAADEESYLRTNVTGTANMLELARMSGAAFYHMSTCSVSGELLKDSEETQKLTESGKTKDFTEKDYDMGQIWEDNIYVKSKFLAEGLVLQAVREGLNARIFRLGRLVGRASDGVFQRNPETNAFYLLVRGFCQVGAVAETAVETVTDLMPVDVAVEEMMALREGKGLIYHIMNQNPPALGEVLKALNEEIQFVSEKMFADLLQEKSADMDRELQAMVMNNWQIFKNARPVIAITNKLTMEHLKEQGMIPEIPAPEKLLKGFDQA